MLRLKWSASLLAAVSVMLLAQPVNTRGEEWTASDTYRQIGVTAAIAADCATTISFLRQGYEESNPILGRHPSNSHVAMACAISAGGTFIIARMLPRKVRVPFQYIVIGLEGGIAFGNAMSIGWRF